MVIDSGTGLAAFRDMVDSTGEYVDVVKFGWGTALATPRITEKIDTLREHGIPWYFGGTLFEKFLQQERVPEYLDLVRKHGAGIIEVSNGTFPISNADKAAWVKRLSGEFRIFSEVGSKDPAANDELSTEDWVSFVEEDLAAGAEHVITEARESGSTGIADSSGNAKDELIAAILDAVSADRMLFEAPTKILQTHFVTLVGPEVNLGNIAPTDLVGVETLRLGLRSDTFFAVDLTAS
jgi:phosphosulfolactate synthase